MAKMHVPHVPPKKILVPLDASDASVAAWKQALSLAQRFAATVEGLYVQEWLNAAVGVGMSLGPEPFLPQKAKKNALESLRSKLGDTGEIRLVEGPIEETIVSWGRRRGFDLIVMGTHGHTGIERAIKGSIAETVIRHTEVPVMVVKKAAVGFKMVLAPVNLESYSLGGLSYAAKLAGALGARLKVLHVFASSLTPKAAEIKDARHFLQSAIGGLPQPLRRICLPQPQLAFGSAAAEIAAAAKRADLVVMVAHRKGFLSEMVFGSTVERVLRHCAAPVLVIPSGPVKTAAGARGQAAYSSAR